MAEQKFKPILFSTPMILAIKGGRKTMTRRTIKPQPECYGDAAKWKDWVSHGPKGVDDLKHLNVFLLDKCPYGKKGDVLWVRETFTIIDWWEDSKAVQVMYEDAKTFTTVLTDEEWNKFDKWQNKSERKPSLYLFKSLCRIFLEITGVRVERLQDISGDDVLAEGVDNGKSNKAMGIRWENMQRMAFEDLWNKINGNWNENPFVWCVSFKKIDKPENFK